MRSSTLRPRAKHPKQPFELLNVSFGPTSELYQQFNAAFARPWQDTSGQTVAINNPTLAPARRRAR